MSDPASPPDPDVPPELGPDSSSSAAPDRAPQRPRSSQQRVGRLRGVIPLWQKLAWGAVAIAVAGAIWTGLTWGERSEDRIVSQLTLPSPVETFGTFKSLWFEREMTRNTFASLRRVVFGFTLAILIGVPLGVWCGCFPSANAFMAPLTIFGRNVPMAALIPITFSLFGYKETQKIMFILIAALAFVVSDSAQAVRDVAQRYIDTAYTLGASRRQVILKVLVPLAMPDIFNSLRLLFGLAFGYIMLAEVIAAGEGAGGLGQLIFISQKRGPNEHIYLILILIPVLALGIDQFLWFIQRQFFPHRYGGDGMLAIAAGHVGRGWEAVRERIFDSPLNQYYAGLIKSPKDAADIEQSASGTSQSEPEPDDTAGDPS